MQTAGSITASPLFQKIQSIGFELESAHISPCVIIDDIIVFKGSDNVFYKSATTDYIRSTDTTLLDVTVPFSTFESNLISNGHTIINEGKKSYDIRSRSGHDSKAQEIYHTEFKITYRNPDSVNSMLLYHCKKAISVVMDYYKPADIVFVTTDSAKRAGGTELYLCKMPHEDAFAIVPPNLDINGNVIIDVIPWHIQCTIGIKLVDLMDVIKYISIGNGYDIASVIAIQEKCLEDIADPTAEEINMCFLYAMYRHKKNKKLCKSGANDYIFAVRHNFHDIYDYHKLEAGGALRCNIPTDPLTFAVQQFAYTGIILVELRDFYDQLIYSAFEERTVGYDFGKPLSLLMEAVELLEDMV